MQKNASRRDFIVRLGGALHCTRRDRNKQGDSGSSTHHPCDSLPRPASLAGRRKKITSTAGRPKLPQSVSLPVTFFSFCPKNDPTSFLSHSDSCFDGLYSDITVIDTSKSIHCWAAPLKDLSYPATFSDSSCSLLLRRIQLKATVTVGKVALEQGYPALLTRAAPPRKSSSSFTQLTPSPRVPPNQALRKKAERRPQEAVHPATIRRTTAAMSTEHSSSSSSGRLLLVSNRLPITIKRSDDGNYSFSMSSGGLVTGLSGLSKTTTFEWYGWPGLEVPDAEAGPMIQRLKEEYKAHPVFVDDELADRHYNGFASGFPAPSDLWPFYF